MSNGEGVLDKTRHFRVSLQILSEKFFTLINILRIMHEKRAETVSGIQVTSIPYRQTDRAPTGVTTLRGALLHLLVENRPQKGHV
jgi:hypothetical protein